MSRTIIDFEDYAGRKKPESATKKRSSLMNMLENVRQRQAELRDEAAQKAASAGKGQAPGQKTAQAPFSPTAGQGKTERQPFFHPDLKFRLPSGKPLLHGAQYAVQRPVQWLYAGLAMVGRGARAALLRPDDSLAANKERAATDLGRTHPVFRQHAEKLANENIRTETTRGAVRETLAAMLIGLAVLGLFNSGPLRSWARDLPGGPVSDAVVAGADLWHAQMERIGAANLAEPLRAEVNRLRELRW